MYGLKSYIFGVVFFSFLNLLFITNSFSEGTQEDQIRNSIAGKYIKRFETIVHKLLEDNKSYGKDITSNVEKNKFKSLSNISPREFKGLIKHKNGFIEHKDVSLLGHKGRSTGESFRRVEYYLEDLESRINEIIGDHEPKDVIIEIKHFGEFNPLELKWLINHLFHSGYNVKPKLLDKNKLSKNIYALEKAHIEAVKAQILLFDHLYYTPQGEKLSEPKNSHLLIRNIENIWASVRYNLGLPHGISFSVYRGYENIGKHLPDLTFATLQGYIIGQIIFLTMPDSYDFASKLGTFASILLLKAIPSYLDVPNHIFFRQGMNYSKNTLNTTNYKFYILSSFTHSFIISLLVKMLDSAFSANEVFMFNDVIFTLWNTSLGIFAKTVPTIMISRKIDMDNISSKRPNDTLRTDKLFNTRMKLCLIGILFGTLKYIHLIEIDFFKLSHVYVTLGLLGFSYEIFKYLLNDEKTVFKHKKETWREYFRLRVGIIKKRLRSMILSRREKGDFLEGCDTLLVVKSKRTPK